MCLFEITYGYSGIDLGRFKGFMTEQFLDGPDIGLILEHCRGTGMAKGMGRDVF